MVEIGFDKTICYIGVKTYVNSCRAEGCNYNSINCFFVEH